MTDEAAFYKVGRNGCIIETDEDDPLVICKDPGLFDHIRHFDGGLVWLQHEDGKKRKVRLKSSMMGIV